MADNSATSGLPPEDMTSSEPSVLLDSCRVCMARNTCMQPIFEDQVTGIAQKVLYCTGVLFTQDDGYPSQLCLTCLQDLSVAHSFKSRCVQSNKAFQSLLPTVRVKSEPVDFDYANDLYSFGQDDTMEYEDIKQDIEIDILKSEPDIVRDKKTRVKKVAEKYLKKIMNKSESTKTSMKREYQRKKKVKFKKYCEACDTKFDSKKAFQDHKIAVHNEPASFTCEFCGRSFSRATTHDRHVREHLELTTSKSPKSSVTRKRMLRMKYKKLYCNICDIKFSSKQESDEHKKTLHNEPKIYVCEFCGKSFTNASTHYTHVRTHQAPQYKCEHCSYMSNNKHDLSKHLRIHSGIKSFQCESCPASYHTISNLRDHSRRMHGNGVKRFQCHLCEKQFYDRTKLNRHIDSHNDVKRFLCPVCHSSFTRRCYWKKHLEQKHNIILPRQRPGRQRDSAQMELELISRLIIGDKATGIPDKFVDEKQTIS